MLKRNAKPRLIVKKYIHKRNKRNSFKTLNSYFYEHFSLYETFELKRRIVCLVALLLLI